MTERDPCHQWDKIGLFALAGLVVLVLGGVVLGVFWRVSVPDKGDVLLGGIATGLILFLRDLVTAVRSSWEEVTKAKVNEQLAGSSPSQSVPDDVEEAAQVTADAAQNRADKIRGKGGV